MNNYDDILDVKAEPPKDSRPQWQVKQQQNRETAYQITDAAIEEFSAGKADVRKYLDVQSRFLNYSVRNTLLVMKKNPEATRIGDYNYWKSQNAEVLRDETKNPIIILEPGKEFKREDGSVGQYYNAKEVYDVSPQSPYSYHVTTNLPLPLQLPHEKRPAPEQEPQRVSTL